MNRKAIRKSYRAIIVIGLAVTMALSANVAMAANRLIEEGSGVIELQPTPEAGDSTAQVEYRVVTLEDGSVIFTVALWVNGVENPQDIEVFLVDRNEPRVVGILIEDSEVASVQIDNLEDLDEIVLAKPDEYGGPSVAFFTAELPHKR